MPTTCSVLAPAPRPLLVEPEVLGRTYAALIGGHHLEVHVPRILDDPGPSTTWPRLAPPAHVPWHPWLDSMLIESELDGDRPNWGHRIQRSMMLNAVALTIPLAADTIRPDDATLAAVSAGLPGWWSRLERWSITVLRRADYGSVSYPTHALYGIDSDGRHWRHGHDAAAVIIMGLRGLTDAELRWILEQIDAGHEPPIEQLLLVASPSDDSRRRVLDLGTAVEVALANAVRRELSRHGLDADAIEEMVVRANGMVGLHDLATAALRRLLPVSRRRLMDQLANPRNAAAHRGADIEPLDMKRASAVARELVDHLSPLGSPVVDLEPALDGEAEWVILVSNPASDTSD
jgi:hypothetical protein